MKTSNFIKNIFEKNITEVVHNAFTRYSIGDFVKEPFVMKVGKKDVTVYTGFEYLNFLHDFLSSNVSGDVEINGVIESVKDIGGELMRLGLDYSEERRFGKSGSKFVLIKQKIPAKKYKDLVESMFGEYLLFDVGFTGGLLKVKSKSTPKLGSPTNRFITMKLSGNLLSAFKEDYLFDFNQKDGFKELQVEQTYHISQVEVDDKLLAKDPHLARKKAVRVGEISRKIIVDGQVLKDYKIKFKV